MDIKKEKDEYNKKFGQHLQKIREKKGLSQRELAYKMDADRYTITRLEEGGSNPTIFTLKRISEALEIPPKELLNFDV